MTFLGFSFFWCSLKTVGAWAWGSCENTSEHVSADYRAMKKGREVRKKKQLGPSAMLFPEQEATDNVGTSEAFMFKLRAAVKAEQARTRPTPLSRLHIRFFSSTVMALKSNTLNIAYVVFTALDSPQTTFCQSYKWKLTMTCNFVTVHILKCSLLCRERHKPAISFVFFHAWINGWAHNMKGTFKINTIYILFTQAKKAWVLQCVCVLKCLLMWVVFVVCKKTTRWL